MKSKIILCILFLSTIALNSCSSDDELSNSSTSQFINKWWYSPENELFDIYFNSNGEYESVYFFGGADVVSNGEWEWVDESAKIFRVFNLQGNAVDEYYGKVINLNDNSLTVEISFDGGATYSGNYLYVDTNN